MTREFFGQLKNKNMKKLFKPHKFANFFVSAEIKRDVMETYKA
jgi:hypothetical protein